MSVFNNDPGIRADEKYREHVRRGEFEQAKLQRGWYPQRGPTPTPALTKQDRINSVAWMWSELAKETYNRGLMDEEGWKLLRSELFAYNPTTSQRRGMRKQHAAYLRRLADKVDVTAQWGPAVWASSPRNYTGIVMMLRNVADFLEDDSTAV